MKNLGLICLLLLITGCTSPTVDMELGSENKLDVVKEESNTNIDQNNDVKLVEDSDLIKKYEEWGLEKVEGEIDNVSQDCLVVQDPYTNTGDLLSSMISNNEYFIDSFEVERYSDVSFLVKLENLVAGKYIEKFGENYNAHLVCNISDQIDIVAGVNSDLDFAKGALFLVDDGVVTEIKFDQNIRGPVFGNTATGAEPALCTINSINNSTFFWDCFEGLLVRNESEGVIGSKLNRFEISFDGKVLNMTEIEEIHNDLI